MKGVVVVNAVLVVLYKIVLKPLTLNSSFHFLFHCPYIALCHGRGGCGGGSCAGSGGGGGSGDDVAAAAQAAAAAAAVVVVAVIVSVLEAA